MLSIWRANVDCQPVLCKHVVLKYISKYASKVEPKSETYHAILSRLAHAAPSESPILQPIKQFLAQTVAERDISAQEMCHMLQKIPLVLCSCHLFSLNMSQIVFCCVSNDTNNTPTTPPFIFSYMQRPIYLEHLTLLEAARSWSFSPNRKKNPWKQNLRDKIVRVYPHFTSIPPSDSSSFEQFCWSELLLYKPFRSIPHDIGTTTYEIISHWHHIKGTYVVCHIQHAK